jgi:glycosyltransferase involved in cell wall biosynthesis
MTEAMATKTPVVAPDNTSFSEMGAMNRVKLIPSGADPSMWIVKEGDNERIRPLMDVKAAADAIEKIMDGQEKPNVEAAFQWVSNLNWSNICKQWIAVVDEAAMASAKENFELEQKRGSGEQFMNRAQRRKLEGR